MHCHGLPRSWTAIACFSSTAMDVHGNDYRDTPWHWCRHYHGTTIGLLCAFMTLPWPCRGLAMGWTMALPWVFMPCPWLIDTLGLDRSYAVRRGKQHPWWRLERLSMLYWYIKGEVYCKLNTLKSILCTPVNNVEKKTFIAALTYRYTQCDMMLHCDVRISRLKNFNPVTCHFKFSHFYLSHFYLAP